jgi:ribosome maturation factor RimP
MGKKKEKNIKATEEQFSWHLERLNPMFKKIVCSLGFNLESAKFERESGFDYLRITISHEDRIINLDDCEVVSRAVNNELDEDNKIDFPYSLEVQSPGVDVPLERLSIPAECFDRNETVHEFSVKGLDLVVNS